MSKRITLTIDQDLYQTLEQRFKSDEQGLQQFIIDAIRKQLTNPPSLPDKKGDLEDYLKKGTPGSRTYGIKGQGW